MKAARKLESRSGFTLAETLLAVAILLLVSVIVATGMPAARQAYEKVVLASNAEVLLSTAASTLRDELGTAWKVEEYEGPYGKGITYFSADTGTRATLTVDSGGKITLKEYSSATANDFISGNKAVTEGRELVFQSKNDTTLKVICERITLDKTNRIATISGLCVKHGETTLAEWKENDTAVDLSIPVFSVGDQTQNESDPSGLSLGD